MKKLRVNLTLKPRISMRKNEEQKTVEEGKLFCIGREGEGEKNKIKNQDHMFEHL